MSKKNNDWKKREGVVYSTNENFAFEYSSQHQDDTLHPGKQNLRVLLDKSGRAGKQVTLVTGFIGSSADIEDLSKKLKAKCGVGGSIKDGIIIIQGDMRDKVLQYLLKEGYGAKRSG